MELRTHTHRGRISRLRYMCITTVELLWTDCEESCQGEDGRKLAMYILNFSYSHFDSFSPPCNSIAYVDITFRLSNKKLFFL